jgi:hypothetical protein
VIAIVEIFILQTVAGYLTAFLLSIIYKWINIRQSVTSGRWKMARKYNKCNLYCVFVIYIDLNEWMASQPARLID